jgi:hypothetical protein
LFDGTCTVITKSKCLLGSAIGNAQFCSECQAGYYLKFSTFSCVEIPKINEPGYLQDCARYTEFLGQVRCQSCTNGKYSTSVYASDSDLVDCSTSINLTNFPYLEDCDEVEVPRTSSEAGSDPPNAYYCRKCKGNKYLKSIGLNQTVCSIAVGNLENCSEGTETFCNICNTGYYQPDYQSKCIKLQDSAAT